MSKKIRVQDVGDGQIAIGGVLNEQQQAALHSRAPTAEDILNSMNELNEEIEESYGNLEEATETKTMPEVNVPKPSRKRRGGKKFDAKNRVATPKKKEKKSMNLDQELDDLNSRFESMKSETDSTVEGAEDTTTTTDTVPGGDMRTQILDLLKNTPNAPTEQNILQWKAKYGNNGVHVMALGEGDVYIFTHLKRGQWKKIQDTMAKLQEAGGNKDIEDELKEKVIQYCTLWPQLSLEFFYNSRAGVCDSLYQVILLNSYFLSPQQAMMLTTQL